MNPPSIHSHSDLNVPFKSPFVSAMKKEEEQEERDSCRCAISLDSPSRAPSREHVRIGMELRELEDHQKYEREEGKHAIVLPINSKLLIPILDEFNETSKGLGDEADDSSDEEELCKIFPRRRHHSIFLQPRPSGTQVKDMFFMKNRYYHADDEEEEFSSNKLDRVSERRRNPNVFSTMKSSTSSTFFQNYPTTMMRQSIKRETRR